MKTGTRERGKRVDEKQGGGRGELRGDEERGKGRASIFYLSASPLGGVRSYKRTASGPAAPTPLLRHMKAKKPKVVVDLVPRRPLN